MVVARDHPTKLAGSAPTNTARAASGSVSASLLRWCSAVLRPGRPVLLEFPPNIFVVVYRTIFSRCNCSSTTMASIFKSFPLLRTAAPRLTRQFFTCQAQRIPQIRTIDTGIRRASRPSWILQCHYQSTHAPQHVSSVAEAVRASAGKVAKKTSFPQTSDKSVAYWLLGSAASVFGIVIFGGLTRLTESGYDSVLSSAPARC